MSSAIVYLLSSDEESEADGGGERWEEDVEFIPPLATRASLSTPAPASTPTLPSSTCSSSSGSADSNPAVSLLESEVAVKQEPVGVKFGEADVGDEVVELRPEGFDEDSEAGVTGADGAGAGMAVARMDMDDDDDLPGGSQGIAFIGGNMMVMADLPHQREACCTHPFVTEAQATAAGAAQTTTIEAAVAAAFAKNLTHCPNCFCFVCDVNVTECLDWSSHCSATMNDFH